MYMIVTPEVVYNHVGETLGLPNFDSNELQGMAMVQIEFRTQHNE